MFVHIGAEYAALCEQARQTRARRRRARAEVAEDGRTSCSSTAGTASGSCAPTTSSATRSAARSAEEAQIFIEPQGFCVMAGIGVEDGRGQEGARLGQGAARHALRHRAATTRRTRATTSSSARSPRTRPGYKENAGIFCHNNPWMMIAETVVGRGDRAFDYYKKIAPAYLEEISEVHRTRAVRVRADDRGQGRRPPRRGQELAGSPARRPGTSSPSRSTCSACARSTTACACSPCIGTEVAEFTVTRAAAAPTYRIHVKNTRQRRRAASSPSTASRSRATSCRTRRPARRSIVECEV